MRCEGRAGQVNETPKQRLDRLERQALQHPDPQKRKELIQAIARTRRELRARKRLGGE